MKLYIYNYVYGMTDNWHSGAGVTIITDRDPVEVLTEHAVVTDPDYREVFAAPTSPDLELDVDCTEEKVFIFPDAGCC